MRTTAFVILLLGAFLLGVLVVVVLAHSYGVIKYPERLDLSSFDWNGISAIAALLTVAINVLLVLTVVIGFKSVQEGQAARSAQVLAWASEQMDKVKEDERCLRDSSRNFHEWDNKTQASARRVINAYQRMCYYAHNGLIDARHLRHMWGINTVVYWLFLEPYIKSERKRFNDFSTLKDGAHQRAEFEAVALDFIAYFEKKNPKMLMTYRNQPFLQTKPSAPVAETDAEKITIKNPSG